jgi:tetratricopeptide (TPR) repeat protein
VVILYHRGVPEPLEPHSAAEGAAGENPLILVPVTAEDAARQKRRKVLRWVALIVVVLAISGWIYKRSTDPLRAQESFDAAQRLFAVARYDQAIVACDRAISLKPDFVDAYMLRGRSHVAQYDPQHAIPDFTKAMALRPSDPQAPLERALAYIDQKNYTAALSDVASALALDPKLARAYNVRGTALRALGDPQKAIQEFDRAVELEPNSDNFYQRGATYQILGDHKRAILDFTSAIAWSPDKPQAYFARAESERALGEKEKAEKDHSQGRYLDSR